MKTKIGHSTQQAFGRLAVLALTVAFTLGMQAQEADAFIECESFSEPGGWVIDTASIRQMGSAYLMAHGKGTCVADATGQIRLTQSGTYHVWARTRNWNAEWTKGAAGRFQVSVNGICLENTLGTGSKEWRWVEAGSVACKAGTASIHLVDRSGFNGRCDALYFTTAALSPEAAKVAAEEARAKKRGHVTDDPTEWDLVVVGGGISGCAAALAASRYGMKTLLLQDRGVLGGCNSSEVRVSAGGFMHVGPYPKLGNILEEILPVRGDYCILPSQFYEDERKANIFSYPDQKARLRLNKYAYGVETNGTGKITAVTARDVRTGQDTRYRAHLFCDATGDGTIARLAGCATMYGREARARWDEACAPLKADRQVMGHSIQWTTRSMRAGEKPFPNIDAWALPFNDEQVRFVWGGSWWQEAGQYRDMAEETEAIRDYGLLGIFSNWNYIQHHTTRRGFKTATFDWVSPIGGKRESHRVIGDYILTETDLEEQRTFNDGTAVVTWDIDFHFPDPDNMKAFGEPFRSCAYHRGFGKPVAVPYRCLYARDCANLFLAGRDLSVSHGAFAAVRVQRTLGMLAEVVGIAAGICHKMNCLPREVYTKHLNVLKERMRAGVPKLPDYVAFGGGYHEKYHFPELGFVSVWPNPVTNPSPHLVEAVRSLGMNHRRKHPAFDTPNEARKRRFVLADESRARLHYWDTANPNACFSIPAQKPLWDLKRVGDMRYRTVCYGGFTIIDLKARKVAETFKHPSLDEITAVCDMNDGGFICSVNPRQGPDKDKVVLLRRFSAKREPVATYRCEGFFYARSLEWDRDGKTLLLAWEKGFARLQLPQTGNVCQVVGDYRQPKGRNLFDVVPARLTDGYLAGCGYGGGLVKFDAAGKALSTWFVPEQDGKTSRFYAQPKEMPDGRIYMAHWTGHGAEDSHHGWQVVEFGTDGKVLWHLDDAARLGSISGIDVLEE